MFEEFRFDGRVMTALERLNIGTGFGIFCRSDFATFFENLSYFGTRLAKLHVDTRSIARSLELYSQFCEPYLDRLSPMARAEGIAALESFSSTTYVTVTGNYFDAQRLSSTTLLSVLDAELSSANLSALLDKILRVTTGAFGAAIGVVLLKDAIDPNTLRPQAAVGLELDSTFEVPVGMGFTGQMALTGEAAILPDLEQTNGTLNPILRQKAKALWGVPLRISDQVIGVLIIGFAKPYDWLPTEKELLTAIAERSALAIEKARFNDTLREREARIAELSAYLLRAQEEERKRISRELHDATGQQLMVIRLYLGMLDGKGDGAELRKKIGETVTVVDQTIEGIRRIIAKLSPLVLEELGLIAAVRKEAKDFTKQTGVRTRVAISDDVGRLSNQTETAVYRVIQEAFHNVAKHAKAKNVTLQMGKQGDAISLVIQDDGVGIASGPVLGRNFGLSGMRERVAMLGGTAKVASSKNKGTRIEVKVPVTQRAESERGANRGDMRPFLLKRAAAGQEVH